MFATDIDESGIAALEQAKASPKTARLDVRNTADVDAFAKRVGKIDILLNAAGFVHHGTILDCSDEDWDFSFDLNVKSMHRTIKRVSAGDAGGRRRQHRQHLVLRGVAGRRPTATSTVRPRPRFRC